MMSHALIFPGQGSQFAGMLKEHAEQAHIQDRLTMAERILGYDLGELMISGPEEKLTQTEYTQPAIFLHSVSLFETLDLKPDMVAGHSLGEWSALVAAGVLSFEDGLRLVSLRGKLMQQAAEENPGTMAAIIGMDDEVVELICEEATEQTFKPVVAANFNSPGQVVISGHDKAVDAAVELAKGRGCRLAKKLAVSGAFHSPLMEPAYNGLKDELEPVSFSKPACPVYSNYTAAATSDPQTLKSNLLEQLVHPVRWRSTLLQMEEDGATRFTEIGPGNVLQGLVKRTVKGVEISGYQ